MKKSLSKDSTYQIQTPTKPSKMDSSATLFQLQATRHLMAMGLEATFMTQTRSSLVVTLETI